MERIYEWIMHPHAKEEKRKFLDHYSFGIDDDWSEDVKEIYNMKSLEQHKVWKDPACSGYDAYFMCEYIPPMIIKRTK